MSDYALPRREALKAGAGLVSVAAVGLPAADPAAGWKAQTLDDHQLRTVEALGELIIPATDTPGAKAAGVHRYVDLFLTDGPDSERGRFLDGLGWLDGYCNSKYAKPFLNLSPADQATVLHAIDAETEPGLNPGNRFFRMAKSMVSRIYYNTEIGYKELNKGGRVPKSYGCVVTPA